MAGHTLKELRKIAETLGYENVAQVQSVLKLGGLDGKFEPSRFKEYVALLMVHAKKTEAFLMHIEESQRESQAPDCPICGAKALWVTGSRRALSAAKWICTEGGSLHFAAEHVARLRPEKEPLDLEEVRKISEARRAQAEVVRRLYWRAVAEELTEAEAEEFRAAYGRYP